jgi:hypothetical protein
MSILEELDSLRPGTSWTTAWNACEGFSCYLAQSRGDHGAWTVYPSTGDNATAAGSAL